MCKVVDTPGGVVLGKVGLFARSMPIPDIDEGSDTNVKESSYQIKSI